MQSQSKPSKMASPVPDITLYASPVSDCSARIRIALRLKNLPFTEVTKSHSQTKGDVVDYQLNPGRTVPTLVIRPDNRSAGHVVIAQSVAALEYLDEAFPDTTRLLPDISNPSARAWVRQLVQIITTDTHTLTTCRVSDAVAALSIRDNSGPPAKASEHEWGLQWIRKGLAVYNTLAGESAGSYSVGDAVTMADVCLMPQLWTAMKFGINFDKLPTIRYLFERLSRLKAFQDDIHPLC